jgi:hypothetical protein
MMTQMRAFLLKWSKHILDIPKLVQLGYGGIRMAPNATGEAKNQQEDENVVDEDDVSSWEGEQQQQRPLAIPTNNTNVDYAASILMEQEQQKHQAYQPLAKKAISKIAANHTATTTTNCFIRRGFLVTKEDKDIIYKLAETTVAAQQKSGPPENNNNDDDDSNSKQEEQQTTQRSSSSYPLKRKYSHHEGLPTFTVRNERENAQSDESDGDSEREDPDEVQACDRTVDQYRANATNARRARRGGAREQEVDLFNQHF